MIKIEQLKKILTFRQDINFYQKVVKLLIQQVFEISGNYKYWYHNFLKSIININHFYRA